MRLIFFFSESNYFLFSGKLMMEFESYFIIYLVAKHSKHPNYDNLSSLLKMKPLHLKNSVIMSECYRICIFGYKCKRYKIDNSQS